MIDSVVKLCLAVIVACPASITLALEARELADEARENEFKDLLTDGLKPWIVEGRQGQVEEQKKKWSLKDGLLHNSGGGFGFIRYEKKLSDFEFKGEYRLPDGGNSGIGIRGVPFTGPSRTRPSFASYELQILSDNGKPPTNKSTMSLYRYVAPSRNASKKKGEWNSFHIICKGPRIVIHLNGEKVMDIDQREHEQIKDKPLTGYLQLQNHGSKIDFRKLKLRELGEPQ